MVTDFRKKTVIANETFVCLKTTAVLFQAYIIGKRMVSGTQCPFKSDKIGGWGRRRHSLYVKRTRVK